VDRSSDRPDRVRRASQCRENVRDLSLMADDRIVRRGGSDRVLDQRDEPIASAGNSRDVLGILLRVAQRAPKKTDVDLQVARVDERVGPDRRDQLVLADQFTAAPRQDGEDIQCARANPDGNVVAQQQLSRRDQSEAPEGQRVARGCVRRWFHAPTIAQARDQRLERACCLRLRVLTRRLGQVLKALDRDPGVVPRLARALAVVVVGHADALVPGARHAGRERL
jgi:hypothetical protein